MAHFAKINENNEVTDVVVVRDDLLTDQNGVEQESLGVEFLRNLYNEPTANWKQTSYNTVANTHTAGGTPFRKNYAKVGGTYDPNRDAFIGAQIYPSWTLDANYDWQAPVPYPTDGNMYIWDEDTLSWVEIEGMSTGSI